MPLIKPPSTYSEWVEILTKFKNREDDEDVLIAMQRGTIDWQSGVADRFSKRLIDAVNYRMNMATDRFQREVSHAMGQERVIVQALVAMRREFVFLSKALNLPVIPEENRRHYLNLVREQAINVQKSLEDSARSDRTGKLASIIRNNRVDSV